MQERVTEELGWGKKAKRKGEERGPLTLSVGHRLEFLAPAQK